ncbi:hypothetical protein [Clostridium botulinum]|uniref:hypothetical protein n=1 Tax=Clostridium botulinum TaxID=1491 RepID=UPI000699EDB2|nr:hypothetical protein [Clostridium botulinum]KOA90861.1 hypothetical protein ADU76_12460 [Clostridium botulinum]MCD3203425.1 hypothetical protein [Clostridium botulinum C/D]MCD3222288.1 hypothetical protein [Clostridium botulinum C/D]MCD3231441.1 hypothetical protein [Clostridium botulinum C/D]MCD3273061.1 hypothetical protein [Clostridium botulinum C/D]
MNSNLVTLISSLGGAILGSFIGYEGVKKQINYEKELRSREEKNKLQKLSKIINTFLQEEIRNNFRVMFCTTLKNELDNDFKSNEEPFNFNLTVSNFRFTEFESIKSELLMSNIGESEKIIYLYVMFKILENNESIQNLNKEQYDFVKQTYLNNVSFYVK